MLLDQMPKISCVMVTVGRPREIEKSVHCYLAQSYPCRELIVLSQASEEANADLKSFFVSLGRSDIEFQVASSRLTLGEMRNTSCELATGSVICQWDDDDLSHPDRLKVQYRALMSDSRNVACACMSFLKYFENSGEIYWCDWSGEGGPLSRFLPGTVMFHKRVFYEFGSLLYPEAGDQCHMEEDLNVLAKFLAKGNVVPIMDPRYYIYTYHGSNTYDLNHHRLAICVKSGKKVAGVEQLLQWQAQLEELFRAVGISKVIVKSLDTVAFVYG